MLSYMVHVWKNSHSSFISAINFSHRKVRQLRWGKQSSGPAFLSALDVEWAWSAFRQPMQGQNECPSKCVTYLLCLSFLATLFLLSLSSEVDNFSGLHILFQNDDIFPPSLIFCHQLVYLHTAAFCVEVTSEDVRRVSKLILADPH